MPPGRWRWRGPEVREIRGKQVVQGGQSVRFTGGDKGTGWHRNEFGRWCFIICVRIVAPYPSAAKAALASVNPTASPGAAYTQGPDDPPGSGFPYGNPEIEGTGVGTWVVAEQCWQFCYTDAELGAGETVSVTVPSGVAGGASATYQSPPRPAK